MADHVLRHRRILVVEDEYLLADELTQDLMDEGVSVIGPVPNVGEALALVNGEDALDGAILDLNLRGESAFPVADALIARGVPIVFTTGYDASVLPQRFAHVLRCEKPISIRRITAALEKAIDSAAQQAGS